MCPKKRRSSIRSPLPFFRKLFLLFGWTQNPERSSSIRPNQNKSILAGRDVPELALRIGWAVNLVTVDFHDHVTAGKAGIVSRTTRLYVGDDCALDLAGQLKLLAQLGRHILKANAPAGFAMLSIRASTGVAVLPVERVHCYRDSHRLAIAHYVQIHFGTRPLLPDDHLQVACIADLVTVDSGNDISYFQTGLGAGRIWLYLADHSANGLVHVEELGIL